MSLQREIKSLKSIARKRRVGVIKDIKSPLIFFYRGEIIKASNITFMIYKGAEFTSSLSLATCFPSPRGAVIPYLDARKAPISSFVDKFLEETETEGIYSLNVKEILVGGCLARTAARICHGS